MLKCPTLLQKPSECHNGTHGLHTGTARKQRRYSPDTLKDAPHVTPSTTHSALSPTSIKYAAAQRYPRRQTQFQLFSATYCFFGPASYLPIYDWNSSPLSLQKLTTARDAPTRPDVLETEQRQGSMSKGQNDEPCAFAKLWGQLDGLPFHCYMTSLPSTLGRGSIATQGSRKPAGFIDLGQSKALSREHGEKEIFCLVFVSRLALCGSWCVGVAGAPVLEGSNRRTGLPPLSQTSYLRPHSTPIVFLSLQ